MDGLGLDAMSARARRRARQGLRESTVDLRTKRRCQALTRTRYKMGRWYATRHRGFGRSER